MPSMMQCFTVPLFLMSSFVSWFATAELVGDNSATADRRLLPGDERESRIVLICLARDAFTPERIVALLP